MINHFLNCHDRHFINVLNKLNGYKVFVLYNIMFACMFRWRCKKRKCIDHCNVSLHAIQPSLLVWHSLRHIFLFRTVNVKAFFSSLCDLFVCLFVALRPKSTAMVFAGRSVHLTTLFPGQA